MLCMAAWVLPLQATPMGAATTDVPTRTVTLLFTNDLESAYEPTPAYWRNDLQRIGGIAQLASLVEQIRATQPNVFLFDAGDIFTGTLAKATFGAVSFEVMMTMGYDAMAIGNHEFEYGWQEFARQKQRVPFPVLGANLFYRGTSHRYAQPYTIIERQGVRLGVIGVLGRDAATALVPAHIDGLDVHDPVETVRTLAAWLKPQVDLVVVLTHQGHTAPMQTDDEADPRVHRGNAANLALAGAVPDIDVILGGHTDAGTREPLVHPDTGALIMQTFGQGQHLGMLQLALPLPAGRARWLEAGLLTVDSDRLPAHPGVQAKLQQFRAAHAALFLPVGQATETLTRRYYDESDLGNFFADVLRAHTGTEVALMPSGALRKDLPAGVISRADLLDAFPFKDRIARVTLSGKLLQSILEQGLSLERGLLQVSGLQIRYDPQAPVGERLHSVLIAGQPLQPEAEYVVSTVEILAQGGDAYTQFREARAVELADTAFASALEAYVARAQTITVPSRGRVLPLH